MTPRWLVHACAFLVAGLAWVVHAQQTPANPNPSGNFTGGKVTTLTGEGRISYYVFESGSRTRWHSHEGGQLLLAEEGLGRTQLRGGPVRDLRPGDSAWSPPGVAHWHGASPGRSAKLYQVSRGATTWMEEVGERDYSGK
jgi:quercetin dioxygenase-like cupin family protein